jgi:4-amino-4-deoxy-L-arabinose transferase-like glycosyltransferase
VSTTFPEISRPRLSVSAGERLRGLARGRPEDPRFVRPTLLAVIALAAALCLWKLTRDGYSNEYYAAAVKAGSESWKAWFFGALDPGSFITVDKPPLALWVMGLSARVFGFSSASMLLPEALATVAAVALLYATVRRLFGPTAGLVAAAALAISPVTVAIGRVNNPDALLVLLFVAAAYLLVRALDSGRTKHLVWCGVLVGLAFMTKMLEGWMVVPAFATAYLVAGPPRLAVRIRQLLAAGFAMVAVSAAWPLAVSLWPAASRPYIGGSANGSIWNLIFGYNGFGRLTGASGGPGGGGGITFGGAPGLLRMFNAEVGGQVAWLIPLAGISLIAGLWLTRRAPRRDRERAGWILFGVWALVLVGVFSSQNGIFHPYYVSTLAPAVAALAGAGLVTLWSASRRSIGWLAALDGAIVVTAWLAVRLLDRAPGFAPALRIVIVATAALAVVTTLLAAKRASRPIVALMVAAVAVAVAAGPVSYSLASLGRSLDGNNVLAGPASAARGGGPGGGPGGPPGFARGAGFGPGGPSAPGVGGPPPGSAGGAPPFGGASAAGGFAPPRPGAGGFAGAGGSPPGGPRGGSVGKRAISYLEAHQGSAKYLVAATGSQTTAPIIIQTGRAVVTIGGFNGGDPAPTVSQLASLVSHGELRFVLVSSHGGGPGPRGGAGSQRLSAWAERHGTVVRGLGLDGMTLYRVAA